jgi:hypothetical protein
MGSSLTSQTDITRFTPQEAGKKLSDGRLFAIIFVTALLSVPLFLLAGSKIGYSLIIALVLVAIGALIVAVWPLVGFFAVAASIFLVEQNQLKISVWTDMLNVFYWPPKMAGLPERPIGVLILYIFFVIIAQRYASHQKLLRGGPVLIPYLLFLTCVIIGIAHGLTSGGTLKIVVVEVRPFWYMFVSYILAYNLITKKIHVQALFWLAIAAAGVKGCQGVYVYLGVLQGNLTGYREIMAHEESFFFVGLLLLIVIFCLHSRHKGQLWAAIIVTPPVLLALIANQRRTDYVALLLGIGVAWLLTFICKPKARAGLLVTLIIAGTLGTVYIAAFSHVDGAIGSPARSIISVFNPSEGDASSNAYRVIENFNLKTTVQQSPIIGWGFGKEFLQPWMLPNILVEDPYYLYVPHNTIYWVWMRLGAVGYAALWFLLGSVIIRGIHIAKQLRDKYLQMSSIFIISIIVMEVVVAYADYQLFFFRNVIYLGILIGILLKLPEIEKGNPFPVTSQKTADLMKREILDAHSGRQHKLTGVGRRS